MRAKIQRRNEECQCDQCGYPMYIGDTVVYRDDYPYCSNGCARAADERPSPNDFAPSCSGVDYEAAMDREAARTP